MEGFAPLGGRLDVSIVLPADTGARSLLVGLDDATFEPPARLREAQAEPSPEGFAVAMSQSMLTELDEIELNAPAENIEIAYQGRTPILKVSGGGAVDRHFVHDPQILAVASRQEEPGGGVRLPRNSGGIMAWKGSERRFMQISYLSGRPEIVAEYSGRSAQDVSATEGALFVQASDDGMRLKLYRRGPQKTIAGPQWEEGHESSTA
jgi:hypothetical protein